MLSCRALKFYFCIPLCCNTKVCKSTGVKKQHQTYTFRSCISLLNVIVIQCDSLKSEHVSSYDVVICGIVTEYKHGVQLVSSIDGKVVSSIIQK